MIRKTFKDLNTPVLRDVTIIYDNGFSTQDMLVGPDGTERIRTDRQKIEAQAELLDAIWKICPVEPDQDFWPYVTISVLKRGSSLEDYLANRSEHAQELNFAYGRYGELYMLPLPSKLPAKMTFEQLEDVVKRHFDGYSTATIIARRQGGFGAAGAGSLLDQVLQWLLEQTASHAFEILFFGILAYGKKLLPRKVLRKREERYAQIARDMISRDVTSLYALSTWLSVNAAWTTPEVMTALVLPRRLTVRLLKQAGYRRVGMTKTWVLGNDVKSRRRREDWTEKVDEGHNWSPLQ